jgi:hypothetical protein
MFKTLRTKAKHFIGDTYLTQKFIVHNLIILQITSIQYIFNKKVVNKRVHKMKNMLLKGK